MMEGTAGHRWPGIKCTQLKNACPAMMLTLLKKARSLIFQVLALIFITFYSSYHFL